MKIEINLDSSYTDPKIVIHTNEVTPQISAMVDAFSSVFSATLIMGYRDGLIVPLEFLDIIRIYAEGQQVLAQTSDGTYTVRYRLYELEEMCRGTSLVRISNSEIVNFKKAKGFDLSTAGTISIHLADGQHCFVSRRYVGKIKEYLGL